MTLKVFRTICAILAARAISRRSTVGFHRKTPEIADKYWPYLSKKSLREPWRHLDEPFSFALDSLNCIAGCESDFVMQEISRVSDENAEYKAAETNLLPLIIIPAHLSSEIWNLGKHKHRYALQEQFSLLVPGGTLYILL